MNTKFARQFKLHAAAIAAASCVSMLPGLAEAAGLGKITVLSALGQPLKAEVEVNAGRDELLGMAVRLASQESFRQAGIEYAPTVSDLRFTLEKRPTGKSVIKVSSSRPINEPFLDFLIELNWPAGRLVSEYTFLLDPPEIAAKAAGPAVSVVEAKSLAAIQGAARKVEPAEKPAFAEGGSAPDGAQQGKALPKADGDKSGGGTVHVVKAGETLRKVAGENQYEGVSLEQMLVGLYRGNSHAFVDGNINRMKAGAILNVPEKNAVAAISDTEAKAIYRTQGAEWNAYRRKLAGAAAQGAARENESSQATSGKVSAKVEEITPPAEAQKDKVKISRTEQSSEGKTKAVEEAVIAKDKTLKEAQERLAHLEKNVADLQKLLEMKNQSLAELQQQLAPAAAAKQLPQGPSGKPAEAPTAPAAVVADAAKAVDAPKPPAPKKSVPPPEPEPEPSFLDTLLENILPLAGGGGVFALLAGFLIYKRKGSKKPGVSDREEPGIPGASILSKSRSAA